MKLVINAYRSQGYDKSLGPTYLKFVINSLWVFEYWEESCQKLNHVAAWQQVGHICLEDVIYLFMCCSTLFYFLYIAV